MFKALRQAKIGYCKECDTDTFPGMTPLETSYLRDRWIAGTLDGESVCFFHVRKARVFA